MYAQANMLVHNFHMRTDGVETALLKAYKHYIDDLWCSYSQAKIKRLQVAGKDAYRIMHKLPRWTSNMFVTEYCVLI